MCPIMGEYTKPEADTDIATHAALTKTHGATTKLADTDDVATHAALTTGVHGVGTGTVGKAVINRLKGLTATLSNWNTDPTNLANITDEDWTTVSGTGTKTCTAGTETASLYFDLGDIRTVLLVGKLGMWASAGQVNFQLQYSLNGTTWINAVGTNAASCSNTSELLHFFPSIMVRLRYIGFIFNDTTAGAVFSVKFYELAALEFPDFIGSN